MRFAGELAALGTASCWAMGSNLFMAAGRRMGSVVLNRLRVTVALVFLCAALWATRGSPWPTWATREQLGLLATSGLVGFVFGDSFYFRALVILGAGRGTLLTSTWPVFTALIAWLALGETLGARAVAGMALVVIGLATVMRERALAESIPPHPEGSTAVGIVSGLLAALGQSLGFVLSKQALATGIEPLPATVIRGAAAVAGLWLLAPVQGGLRRNLRALRDRRAATTMLAGAFFGPFLGVTLSLVSLAHIKAAVAASIISIYPLLAMAIAARFHSERTTPRALAGALVTVAGVAALFLR